MAWLNSFVPNEVNGIFIINFNQSPVRPMICASENPTQRCLYEVVQVGQQALWGKGFPQMSRSEN